MLIITVYVPFSSSDFLHCNRILYTTLKHSSTTSNKLPRSRLDDKEKSGKGKEYDLPSEIQRGGLWKEEMWGYSKKIRGWNMTTSGQGYASNISSILLQLLVYMEEQQVSMKICMRFCIGLVKKLPQKFCDGKLGFWQNKIPEGVSFLWKILTFCSKTKNLKTQKKCLSAKIEGKFETNNMPHHLENTYCS